MTNNIIQGLDPDDLAFFFDQYLIQREALLIEPLPFWY